MDEREVDYGEYEGYPILDVLMEAPGMEGGLRKATSLAGKKRIHGFADPLWLGVKAIPSKHRYEVVRDEGGEIKGFNLIEVYKPVGVAEVTERSVSKGVHESMEAVAKAEALKKSGQRAFELPDPEEQDEGADPEMKGKVDEAMASVRNLHKDQSME